MDKTALFLRQRGLNHSFILECSDFNRSLIDLLRDFKKQNMKTAIEIYIEKMGYTWNYDSIMNEYEKYKKGEYVSHSAKDIIENVILLF